MSKRQVRRDGAIHPAVEASQELADLSEGIKSCKPRCGVPAVNRQIDPYETGIADIAVLEGQLGPTGSRSLDVRRLVGSSPRAAAVLAELSVADFAAILG